MNERKYVLVQHLSRAKYEARHWHVISLNAHTVISLCYSQGASGTGRDLARPKCPGNGNEICTKVTIPKIVWAFIAPWWFPAFMHPALSRTGCKWNLCFVPSSETFWPSPAKWGHPMRWIPSSISDLVMLWFWGTQGAFYTKRQQDTSGFEVEYHNIPGYHGNPPGNAHHDEQPYFYGLQFRQ